VWWPFRDKEATPSVLRRIAALETSFEQVEGRFKLLRIEWESVYEKYRVAMAKLARRDEREAVQEPLPGTNAQPMTESPRAVLNRVFRGQ